MKQVIKKIKIARCWILYHLCFGKKRRHYKQKYKKLREKVFPDDFLFIFNKKITDMYVLTYHSGEVFTFLKLLRSTPNYKTLVQKSLLIATQKYHLDLIEMVCPEMQYTFIPQAGILIDYPDKDFIINNTNIHIIFPENFATGCHSLWMNTDLKVHCFDKIREIAALDADLSKDLFLFFDERTKENVAKKMALAGLKKKFIFIAPEAATIQPVSLAFWKLLYDKLSETGVDVFWNMTKEKFSFGKTVDLSLKEANLLASKASGIISLRSGFSEQLSIIKTIPHIILYTNTWDYPKSPMISAARFREISSLKKYPFTSKNIFEFNAQNADEKLADEIVQMIIRERS
ncbi:MAG: hypothetical protein ACI4OR_03020 [Alphaproteobacteria bacterium]